MVAEKILKVDKDSGAHAIHPGYGFLSENAVFAQQVQDAGLIWVGPNPYAITVMGSKTESRQKMEAAGVPTVPGHSIAIPTPEDALKIAEGIGYPIMLKAAAGGGGKGMREVTCAEDYLKPSRAIQGSQRLWKRGHLHGRRVVKPRHVEVRVMADTRSGVIQCSNEIAPFSVGIKR